MENHIIPQPNALIPHVSYSFHIYAYLLENYLFLKDLGIYDSHILKSLKDIPFSIMIENRM
jgi:hypothetical protein